MKARFNRKIAVRALSLALFLLLASELFVHLTYLFRNTSEARERVISLKEEKENSIDVALIGGSNIFVYWNPMQAWNSHGITSFDYAVSDAHAAFFINAMQEIYRTQTPQLVLVGVRSFLNGYWNTEIDGGYRNYIDSLDISYRRAKAIFDFYKMGGTKSSKELLPTYFDLIYYHNNTDVLKSSKNWAFADNRLDNLDSIYFKGYAVSDFTSGIAVFNQYTLPESGEIEKIPSGAETCLRSLLEYSNEKNIPLLLIESPFIATEYEQKQLNEISRIAEEYKIPFLNLNSTMAWKNMGIDSRTDFYNFNHLNVLGSRKYTEYLSSILAEEYNLPDHRKEEAYSSWGKLYEEQYLPYYTKFEKSAGQRMQENITTLDKERSIRIEENATEWLSMINDKNLTVLMVSNDQAMRKISKEGSLILNGFGIDLDKWKQGVRYAGVYSGKIQYSNAETDSYSKTISTPRGIDDISYSISMTDVPEIQINGKTFCSDGTKGIYMVIVDNNTAKVIDCVILSVGDRGELGIRHLQLD